VHREVRRFNPLKIPTALQAALPFASKPKLQKAAQRPRGLEAKLDRVRHFLFFYFYFPSDVAE
jgi:hypothetical protein